jgi:hypothetical protein
MPKDYRRPYREQFLHRKRCCDLLRQSYLLGLGPAGCVKPTSRQPKP